jgi:threonine/homoserine/homoserine lactone efflux protein
MLLVVIVAFVLGVITSVPVGAVGQLMFNRLMREGFRASFAVGLFSALLDAIYCEIGLVGISLVFDSIGIHSLVQGLSLLILLYYGYKHLLPMKRSPETDNLSTEVIAHDGKQNRSSHLKHFFVVLTATIANPTMFAFWVNMAHVLRSSVLIDMGVREYTLFSITVGLGSAFCQYVVLRIARDVRLFHSPTRRMIIQWLSTSIFMLTISYFIYHFIQELLLNTI